MAGIAGCLAHVVLGIKGTYVKFRVAEISTEFTITLVIINFIKLTGSEILESDPLAC